MWTDGWITIPQNIKDSLDRYAKKHIKPGDFLQAVLQNNLAGAVQRADWTNIKYIRDIVMYCSHYLEGSVWGSPGLFENHLNQDPLRSQEFKDEVDKLRKQVSHTQEVLPILGMR
jgi:hypothetical protein